MKFHTEVDQCLGISFQCGDTHIDAELITYSWLLQWCRSKQKNYKIINRKSGWTSINLKLGRVINFGMENSNMALVFEIDKDFINYWWKRTYDDILSKKVIKFYKLVHPLILGQGIQIWPLFLKLTTSSLIIHRINLFQKQMTWCHHSMNNWWGRRHFKNKGHIWIPWPKISGCTNL